VDLRHLITLCAVIDRGSFSAAAEALGISQPAVSSQIRSLEERLGERLLDRSGRGVRVTEAGRVVERYARQVMALEDALERELGDVDGRIAGRLELGSSTGPGEVLLPGVLGRFRQAHPDVTVSLVVHDSRTICDMVLEGVLDLGIVGAVREQRGLTFTPFLRDELVVITPPSHPLAAASAISLHDLAATELISQQAGSGVRDTLEAAFRAAGLPIVRSSMELGLQQSVKAAVLEGLGVTVISRGAVTAEIADGRLVAVPVQGADLVRDFSTVRAAGRTPARLTTAFLAFAAAELDI
jgi:DNA-binding transcriptional LysR family regulator